MDEMTRDERQAELDAAAAGLYAAAQAQAEVRENAIADTVADWRVAAAEYARAFREARRLAEAARSAAQAAVEAEERADDANRALNAASVALSDAQVAVLRAFGIDEEAAPAPVACTPVVSVNALGGLLHGGGGPPLRFRLTTVPTSRRADAPALADRGTASPLPKAGARSE